MKNPFEHPKIAENYDAFYATDLGKTYDKLEKDVIGKYLDGIDGKLLEMGSGTGHWTQYFSEMGFSVTGIEISDAMLGEAEKKQISNTKFVQGNAETISLNEKFEVVAFITSLEFIFNPISAIENAIAHLKTPGYIVLGVLNSESQLGRSRKESKEITPYTHAKFYTIYELDKIFGRYGKVDLKYCTLNGDNFFIAGRIDV